MLYKRDEDLKRQMINAKQITPKRPKITIAAQSPQNKCSPTRKSMKRKGRTLSNDEEYYFSKSKGSNSYSDDEYESSPDTVTEDEDINT